VVKVIEQLEMVKALLGYGEKAAERVV